MKMQIEELGKARTLRDRPRYKPRPVARRRFQGAHEACVRPHLWVDGRLIVLDARGALHSVQAKLREGGRDGNPLR